MKKIFTFTALTALTFCSISCSSDDNNKETQIEKEPVTEKKSLVGKWDLKTLDVTMYRDGEIMQEIEGESVEKRLVLQFDFKADNTITQYIEDIENNTTRTLTGTYKNTDTELTITIGDNTQEYIIKKVETQNLSLKMSNSTTIEDMNIKTDITYNFAKM